MLIEVVHLIGSFGYEIVNLDCTIVAGRPRLGGLLPSIAARIADLLAVDPSQVNVKASTANLDGMEGAGRGISASAVAVLVPRPADR
jgi:2-C-methyl-D-erythritol 2,4-cyclodiphosphate synthase